MSTSSTGLKQISLLLGLLLIVPLIAFSIVQVNEPEVRKQAFDNLESIAKLKAEGIENWLAERQIDLELLSAGEGFAEHAERLALSGNANSRAFVDRRLAAYSKSSYYHSAILLNASGQALSAIGENNDASAPITQQLLQTALKSGQIVRSDLYRDANTGHAHLDYVLPLRGRGGRPLMVAVLFHVPAENFLFPYIQTWPTPSASAETLLVRRDGNDILFLNELRHRHGTALSLRLPLDATIRPAAAAILSGQVKTVETVDYRGVPVLAATRPVAGTPWHVVAKIDREEVMAPLKKLIFWVSLLALAAVSVVAMAISRLWRQARRSQQLELAAQAATMQQDSDAKYRRLHESMMDAYVMVDMAGNLIDFNSAYREMLGYSYEELRGLTYVDLTPEKWRESEARIVEEQIIPHGQSHVYEKEYMRKDGSVFPVELRAFLLRGKEGQPEAMWAIVRDITERKRNEEELKIFFELIPELVCVASTDGRFLKINHLWQETLGYTEAEILATPFLDLIHPDDRDATLREVERQLAGNATMHFINRYRCKDGSYRWLEWGATPAIDGKLLFAAARDITERLLLDQKLRESEQHFRTLANSGSALIWTSKQDKLCDYFNEPWLRFTGRSLEQELGNGWAEGVHPDDLDRCRETYVTAFDQRKPFSMEYRLRHADGSYRWIRDDGNPRNDSQGEFLGYIGFCIDITAQKELMAELERHRHHLEGLVEERTRELAELVETLRARELTLEQQQHFLKTVTDALPGMVGYWSDDLRCGFANIAYQSWFGKRPEEMIGIRLQELLGDELYRKNEPHIQAALRGEPQRFERTLVKADGSISHAWAHYIPDMVDGRARGFIVLVTDVTALKESQIELEKVNAALGAEIAKFKKAEETLDSFNRDFEAFLDQTTDFIYFKDINSRIRFCSQTLAAITGHAHWRDMIGKRDREVFPPDIAKIYEEEEVPVLAEGRPLLNKIDPYYDAAGRMGYVLTNKWPLFDASGQVAGIFGISRDITDSLAARRALEEAKQAAEAANRAKSAFLANMSHELRTPLNAILGFSDILRREAGLSDAQKENLAIIHRSGDHLLGLINGVLDIAKIEAGGVMLETAPFDFGSMVLDVTDMLRIRTQEKGLQLRVDQPSEFSRYIVGDEGKLRQILINLISNAIKATEEGGVILRLGLKRNQIDHLLIEVEDSGCGIAPEDQVRILEPFVQAGTQGGQQGTGLGLAITRQFVELMGGSLSLDSTVGQGSTFRVEIPVQLAQPDEIPPAPRARGEVTGLASGQSACRVLVVEDQFESQLLLVRLLESVGFEVRHAENGAEAVAQFQNWHPHFIWMDKRMPVMDGVEATRRIRALAGNEAVKIAAVTASTFREDDAQLMAAGFDAIVHKPYRSEQIFECMERLLGLRFERAQAEAEPQPLAELSPTALAALPEALRQELAQALVILDGERILEVIDEIGQTDPELGEALRGRAQNYDYAPILALLQSGPSAAEATAPAGETQA